MKGNDACGNNEERYTGYSCCSGNFKGMRRMMNKFCAGEGSVSDRSDMMKDMMEICCGSKTERAKSDTEAQDETGSD